MKDIAEDLGVSLMTVSKALRGYTDISEETRKRVAKRARELNYQPNWIARSLVTRRTYMVGLIIPDLMHSFFAEVARGVSRKLGPLGYQIVIADSDEDPEKETRQIEALSARSMDGLIIASSLPNWKKGAPERKAPFVLIDRMPSNSNVNYVGVPDEDIGLIATEHLIEQGCRRIAHVRGEDTPNSLGRLAGYRKALETHGLTPNPAYIVHGGRDDSTGCAAMEKLLSLPERPDGVFCYNDPVAAGAIRAVLNAGLQVPRDVAIVGAGNVHYSDLLRIPLTTVDQSSTIIGETAADLLIECIEKAPAKPKRILIPPKLVVRESSKRK